MTPEEDREAVQALCDLYGNYLHLVFGWSDEATKEWVDTRRHDIIVNDPSRWAFHDEPLDQLFEEVVPGSSDYWGFKTSHPHFATELARAIYNGGNPGDPAYDWNAARERVLGVFKSHGLVPMRK